MAPLNHIIFRQSCFVCASISIPHVSRNTIQSLLCTVMLSTSPAHRLSSNSVKNSGGQMTTSASTRRQTGYRVTLPLYLSVVLLSYVCADNHPVQLSPASWASSSVRPLKMRVTVLSSCCSSRFFSRRRASRRSS